LQLTSHPSTSSNLRTGAALVVAASAAFVLIDATAKLLIHDHGTLQIVWARYVFNLAAFVVVLAAGRTLTSLVATRRIGLHCLRAATMLFSAYIYFVALRHITLAEATALAGLAPFIVTACAGRLLGEQVGARQWVAVALGFAGALFIIKPGFAGFHWAMLLAVLCACTRAGYNMATRALGTTEDAMTTLFYGALIGSIVSSAVVPFDWVMPSLPSLALMVVLGISGMVGHFLIIKAYQHAPSSALAPFSYTDLAWATLYGMALFAELPDIASLIGMALIAAAGVTSVWPARPLRTG